MERAANRWHNPVALLTVLFLGACSLGTPHSAREYANAVAVGDPVGTFTTIVGPATAIIAMKSTLRFPDGTTEAGARSVLMYYHPTGRAGTCLFQIGYAAPYSSEIVKEDVVERPCDGTHWARFRIAGSDIAFVGHLSRTNYKGTPVTLLEISDQSVPASMRLVY